MTTARMVELFTAERERDAMRDAWRRWCSQPGEGILSDYSTFGTWPRNLEREAAWAHLCELMEHV